MRVHRPNDLSDGFTRIPNALFRANLTPSQERAWIRIASLERGDFTVEYDSLQAIAEACGFGRSAFFRVIKDLQEAGALTRENDDLHLRVPNGTSELLATEPEAAIPTIQEELDESRRVNTMSEADAKKIFVDTWNEHKPQTYMAERYHMNPATWIAVEQQAKRLKIRREDYASFVKAVCRGLKADEWWSAKSFKVSNVFGFSADLKDEKYQNIEKLYNLGNTKEAAKAAFAGTPADFLDWYNAKGYPVKEIETHEVRDWEHALNIENQKAPRVDRSVARVYYANGKPVFWSGKMSQKALYYLP